MYLAFAFLELDPPTQLFLPGIAYRKLYDP